MENVISALIPLTFLVMLLVEHFFPAKKLPKVRFWLLKGIFFFVLTGIANGVIPVAVGAIFGGRSVLHLAWMGTVAGSMLGFVAADFVGYWVHRTMHRHLWLWKWTHQLHHSAERMDLAGMSYSHPFDILLSFGLPAVATQLLGFSTDAATLAGFFGFLSAVVQHMNIKTPHWLGYFVIRPEAHGLHHERGVHAYNYGNLPLWDVTFGTYRNPADFPAQYGFWDGASTNLGSMLVGRDVGQPR